MLRNHSGLYCTVTIVLACASGAGLGAEIIRVHEPGQLPGIHTGALQHFADESGQLSVDSLDDAAWEKQISGADPTFGYTRAAHWFRFRIDSEGEPSGRVILAVDFEHIDHILLVVLRDGRRVFEAEGGREFSFGTREFPNRRFAFRLPLNEGASTVLLRVHSKHTLNVPLRIMSEASYERRSAAEELRMGAYFGTGLFLLFLNTLFLYAFRERLFLFYVVYLACNLLLVATILGYSFQYLWPNAPRWNQYSLTVTAVPLAVASLRFVQEFLQTRLHVPRLHLCTNGLILFSLLLPPLLFVLDLSLVEALVNAVMLPGALILGAGAGLSLLLTGHRHARFYVLGWTMGCVFISLYIVSNIGLLPNGYFLGLDQYEVLLLGFLCEMIVFPVAIADRIRLLVREQNSAARRYSRSRLAGLNLEDIARRLQDAMETEQLYRRALTLRELAGHVGISEKDLSEYLNSHESASFYEYLNRHRVREARALLLLHPQRKILEIALEVGFASISSFNRAFQRETGVSPREFRKHHGGEPV